MSGVNMGQVEEGADQLHWHRGCCPVRTNENLHELCGDISGQAQAWHAVFQWCVENGMVCGQRASGKEDVLAFLTGLIRQGREWP